MSNKTNEAKTNALVNEACNAIELASECIATTAVANLCYALPKLNEALRLTEDISDRRFIQDWIDRADHDLAMARVCAGC